MVSFEGTVTWLTTGIFKSSCPIDVRFFPFGEASFAAMTDDRRRVFRRTKLHVEIRLVELRQRADRHDAEDERWGFDQFHGQFRMGNC